MERKKLSFKGWVVWWSIAIISSVIVTGLLYGAALFILALLSAVCVFMAVWRLPDFMHEQLSRWFHCMAEKGGFYASI